MEHFTSAAASEKVVAGLSSPCSCPSTSTSTNWKKFLTYHFDLSKLGVEQMSEISATVIGFERDTRFANSVSGRRPEPIIQRCKVETAASFVLVCAFLF